MRKNKIGEFLVEKGLLTPEEVNRIVTYAMDTQLKFGEAGVNLGILRREQPLKKSKVDFFHLNPSYYPQSTRTLFPTALLLKHGIVPLGFKMRYRFLRARKVLNVGFLDPDQKEAVRAVETLAAQALGEDYGGMKPYLVLGEEFMEVIDKIYHVDEEALRRCPPEQLDPTLLSLVRAE